MGPFVFLIEVQLIYNIVLVSSVQHNDSDIYILFQVLFPYRLLQNIHYISLCYTVGLVGYLFYIQQCVYVHLKLLIFFNKFIYFIYLFLAALGLCCCTQAFSSFGEQGLFIVARAYCSDFSCCRAWTLGTWGSVVVARRLQSTGSVVVVHRLSRSVACGIFSDQGSNLCPLKWQADSQPLDHQGSPLNS